MLSKMSMSNPERLRTVRKIKKIRLSCVSSKEFLHPLCVWTLAVWARVQLEPYICITETKKQHAWRDRLYSPCSSCHLSTQILYVNTYLWYLSLIFPCSDTLYFYSSTFLEVNIVLLLGCIYRIALAVLYKVPRGHTSRKNKDILLKILLHF